LFLFGISFGYIEAAVVVYLRALYQPIRERLHPGHADQIFPLSTAEQLRSSAPETLPLVRTEVIREAATIVLLAAAAGIASSFESRLWLPAFSIAFGLWDIFYYVFLRLLVNWPESL
jgi:hypothetical protein